MKIIHRFDDYKADIFYQKKLLMDTSQEHEITHFHFQLKNSCTERANKHFKSQSSFGTILHNRHDFVVILVHISINISVQT